MRVGGLGVLRGSTDGSDEGMCRSRGRLRFALDGGSFVDVRLRSGGSGSLRHSCCGGRLGSRGLRGPGTGPWTGVVRGEWLPL